MQNPIHLSIDAAKAPRLLCHVDSMIIRQNTAHQPTTPAHMRRRTLPLLIPLLAGPACLAQSTSPEVFTTDGGFGTTPQAQLSWTIGEPVTETATGGGNTLTQGFQQPELEISTALPESDPAWSAAVYPNPTASLVRIDLSETPQDATINVFSTNGELVMSERMRDQSQVLDVTRLAAGNYVLDLRDEATGRRARFNLNKIN